ncbi:hypothetical protein G6F55_003144 [Rhizopus delemar]|uniref:dual-specificity kinase n=1 Tax=Rhizopus oryzae TaxID=64495 RepID=A0A9P6YF30_RHIOR|nr:hypothetical protein G6F55_003144 [Rhizopus delemar]KAG1527788.1 hypothetical protein G6F52_001225 [Rhizopus delemar]KAG1546756.1 hypothetical protein G6F51_004681 [Rhizopus arrhizus]KAG1587384.1 hypothetical protein G6F48_005960 [Rhizopus delemar]KAG1632180.1 hypothetical protein G6F45_004303 [Rhizopus arrhizus]
MSNKITPLQKLDPTLPTRLPAPPRRQTTSDYSSKEGQLTPPSSPRKTRYSSIAAKQQTTNDYQELNDLSISSIKTDANKKDSLVPFINASTKAVSLDPLDESMKTTKTLNNTRLPIPIPKKPSGILKCKNNTCSECETQTIEEMVTTNKDQMSTKLRKPEIFASKSIKGSPRLTVCPPSDILQEQIVKERENSTKLSASLISAQGVISQPDEKTMTSNSNESNCMDRIHERLQLYVDNEEVSHEEPVKMGQKRERSRIEAVNAKTALQHFKPFLSPFEETEILKYHSIYCAGSHAKKHMATTDQTPNNYGYDDENGDYQIIIRDHLNYRYEIIESLGKGSFGQVVKCQDMKPKTKDNIVAVKIIRNKKRFHAQALTEIKILEQLMQLDPYNKHFINSYQGFSMALVKRFAYQLLTAVKFLGENNIIHCDLKPENILLKHPDKSGIRVIDLGSSCFVNEKVYSYIQSRFYRAPEVILGMEYGLPIDMWSTGCILAELYTGRPLFPGENELDQLACIMQLLGVPNKKSFKKIES